MTVRHIPYLGNETLDAPITVAEFDSPGANLEVNSTLQSQDVWLVTVDQFVAQRVI